MKIFNVSFILFSVILWGCSRPKDSSSSEFGSSTEFTRVKYNNPGLVSDLGVGLWANPLPVDFDNDGDYDLLVSCNDKPWHGTYFFENKSGEAFPQFEPPVYVGEPNKHIQISYINGEARFLMPGKELLNYTKTFGKETKELFPGDIFEKFHNRIRFNQWKYVDYENDGDLDIIVGIQDGEDYGWDNAYNEKGEWTRGPLHGYVYLIENVNGKYNLKGKIEAAGEPIDVYGQPTPNFDDFDGDGDLDIICGEFIDKFTWFENIGSREKPEYAAGRYLKNSEGIIKMDLEMIIPVALDWDKDGDIDLVVGDEDGRVAFVENTGKIMDKMPLFNSPQYFQQKAEDLKFGALVSPFSVDWDDDGDEDLICGNSAGYLGFIENLKDGVSPQWARPVYLKADGEVIREQAGYSGSIQGPCEAKWGYTVLTVADWNNDGLKDIITNGIWGKILWYENVGSKGNPKLSKPKPVKVEWSSEMPKPAWNWWNPESNTLVTQWRTTPVTIDWNKDGLMDLIILDTDGYLSYFERTRSDNGLVLKPGKHIFYSDKTYNRKNELIDEEGGVLRLSEMSDGKSGRRKIAFADWESDGDLDLIVNSKNAAWFENTGTKEGKIYFTFKGNLTDQKLAGHSTCPAIVDWDRDGVPDILLGAEDGCFYYLKNGQR